MNRQDLSKQFSTPNDAVWKTLVLEAHPAEKASTEYLSDVFGKTLVSPTEDACLHRVDLSDDVSFMRVHVYDGTCGNTVARLVSNLQHRVDGALRIVDPELNALLGVDLQLEAV